MAGSNGWRDSGWQDWSSNNRWESSGWKDYSGWKDSSWKDSNGSWSKTLGPSAQNGHAGDHGSSVASSHQGGDEFCVFLERFLQEQGITSVIDAGCGSWATGYQKCIKWNNVAYYGVDVLSSVIEENCDYMDRHRSQHGLREARFSVGDCCAMMPDADLLICKDVLQHLPNESIWQFLKSHCEGTRYRFVLLAQNWVPPQWRFRQSMDIKPGQLLPLEISSAPFNAPFYEIFTWVIGQTKKSCAIWVPPHDIQLKKCILDLQEDAKIRPLGPNANAHDDSAKAKEEQGRPVEFGVGVLVRIVGLKARAELNGQLAHVAELAFDDRWRVKTESGSKVLLKRANLQIVQPAAQQGNSTSQNGKPAQGCSGKELKEKLAIITPGGSTTATSLSAKFNHGDKVTFQGLKNGVHLNGQVGTIVKQDADTGHWYVQLLDGKLVKAKPENLTNDLPGNSSESTQPAKATSAPKKDASGSNSTISRGSSGMSTSASSPNAATTPVTSTSASSAVPTQRIEIPFAAATLWVTGLPSVFGCEEDAFTQSPSRAVATVLAWTYFASNLHGAGFSSAAAPLFDIILRFHREPTQEVFSMVFKHAHSIINSQRAMLESSNPIPRQILDDGGIGVNFRKTSVAWPSDGNASADRLCVALSNGVRMPIVGFGTWLLQGNECYQAVRWALAAGYRHIDTAQVYDNEKEVGRAIRDSGIPRHEVFIATKLSHYESYGLEETAKAFDTQLRNLKTDYVDLYMLHNTGPNVKVQKAAWQTMERLLDAGKIKALGVSNFSEKDTVDLFSYARHKPVYCQNKFNPYLPGHQHVTDEPILPFFEKNGVRFMGYSIANHWPALLNPMEDPHVIAISQRVKRSPAQVLYRWALQMGVGVLLRSSKQARIRENFQLFDFELQPLEMRLLNGLSTMVLSMADAVRPAFVDDTYALGEGWD